MNYLSNYLYEVAGIELPKYNAFLKDVTKRIPAMNAKGYYSMEERKILTYEETRGQEAEMLEMYHILQYNNMFDAKRKSDMFIK